MAVPPDREQFLRQGDELWDALWAKLGALSDEQLARLGASGPQWSGTDVLAHIARWHDHALEGISAIVEGREPISRSDFDDWNARWFAEDSALTAAQARDRCRQSREAAAVIPRRAERRTVGRLHAHVVGRSHRTHPWVDRDEHGRALPRAPGRTGDGAVAGLS